MTKKDINNYKQEFQRYLLTTLNVLRLNSKITDKEYTRIRNRILDFKEVKS